ncbi:hypothetical protein CAL7102_07570 [Dulcicalothrix desertica PCC 7102]|nr:hypothetical protein CAL7102_07570 [Dulcicalothrix desertica PCC 7102]
MLDLEGACIEMVTSKATIEHNTVTAVMHVQQLF